MRLELLCEMELAYDATGFILVQPYGGEDGGGYGSGTGMVNGERLKGTVRWANHPRRRGDGSMLPYAHGVTRTDDGSDVLFSLQGRTGWATKNGETRGVQLLTAFFEAEAEPYRWLNDVVCAIEGVIDPVALMMRARVFTCVNELA
jgi:hypothetical protein